MNASETNKYIVGTVVNKKPKKVINEHFDCMAIYRPQKRKKQVKVEKDKVSYEN